ncbi:MAG: hypothetical protein J6R80_03045 [Kiritimatiellae bacterium]|nr:hypothetical protein [Kiritimatiellia bacterium]
MNKENTENAVIAGTLAYAAAIVMPLQSYLANVSLFPFSFGRLFLELLIVFSAIFTILFVLLTSLKRIKFLNTIARAVFLSALICIYAESSLLSFGLPEINGGHQSELFSTSRTIWDSCVWGAILAASFAAAFKIGSAVKWIPIALAVMLTASLFDVKKEVAENAPQQFARSQERKKGGVITSGFEWQRDVISNFKFSREENILIFILDSMPGNVSTKTISSMPELAAKFPGFIAFTNNIAMHDCTKRGLPGLMTGEYFDPKTSSPAEYPISIYGEKSFLVPFVDSGWETSFAPDFLPYGFTSASITTRAEVKGKQKRDWAAILRRSKTVPYLSLFDITVFRISPYAAKAPFLYAKIRHDPMFGQDESNFWYEHAMYRTLAESTFSASPRVLGVFHSRGAHPPLAFDKDGNKLSELKWGGDALHDLVLNPLYNLGRLMDSLREKGIYENSFIIVAADHGVVIAPHEHGHHPSESAILWIKPKGSSAALSYSNQPTSYSKIAPLMRALANGDVGSAKIIEILHTDNRLFRYQDANDQYHDNVIGPNGTIISRNDW